MCTWVYVTGKHSGLSTPDRCLRALLSSSCSYLTGISSPPNHICLEMNRTCKEGGTYEREQASPASRPCTHSHVERDAVAEHTMCRYCWSRPLVSSQTPALSTCPAGLVLTWIQSVPAVADVVNGFTVSYKLNVTKCETPLLATPRGERLTCAC